MAYLLFIYNKTDKRNQRFQDFSQNSRIYRTQLQFVNVFFLTPFRLRDLLAFMLFFCSIQLIYLPFSSQSYSSFYYDPRTFDPNYLCPLFTASCVCVLFCALVLRVLLIGDLAVLLIS